LNRAQLRELITEILPLLRGCRVQDVRPLPPRDLVLILATEASEIRKLRLSADRDVPRLHLELGRSAGLKGPTGPFFRRLQQDLVGLKVLDLAQPSLDRIAVLVLSGDAPERNRNLVLELFGRNANLILCDGACRILEVLAPPKSGSKPSAPSRLEIGQIWNAPPIRDAGRHGGSEEAGLEALPEPSSVAPGAPGIAPLSWRVECSLGARAESLQRERIRGRLLERLERKLERSRARLRSIESSIQGGDQAERARQDGELLKANMHRLRRGLHEIQVEDHFAGGTSRTIALDPARSPRQNVEALFAKHRKHQRLARSAEAEKAELAARLAELQRFAALAADPSSDPAELAERALESGLLPAEQEGDPRRRKDPPPRRPYRSFPSTSGLEIWVGRSAEDNDELTLRLARGQDLWLHTADAPGSHVVLRLARGLEPPEQDVLDAAHLAVHFSPLREHASALVHVARAKQVRKPKGAKPGLVHLSGGKTLRLRMQPERLKRLLQGSSRAGNTPSLDAGSELEQT
jgi:predicted ribosome quality control (RQC) complex YloA/Tae2 family protein